jgi:hypothetical protein
MTRETAETLAIEALAWLAGNDELLPVFLGSTGASPADLRERAAEPDFLAGVIEFLMMNDEWVLSFAAASGRKPEILSEARRALSGGVSDWA